METVTPRTDESRMPPGQQLVSADKWPVIGEREPRQTNLPWSLRVYQDCQLLREYSLDDMSNMRQWSRKIDIHCVTRWSKLDAVFQGVTLDSILSSSGASRNKKFISFRSRSERNHSSSLLLSVALQLETLIATHYDGTPLPREHGGPLRIVVPGRYFYKSVKWVEQIDLSDTDHLGYWEAEAGYHNNADPWQEQRYMAPALDKRQAQLLIEKRDFSNLDLRSIDCSLRDLKGLTARNAILRDSNFRSAKLANADFSGANLSNSHFQNADLRHANFSGCDVEGANFSGADLRGANLDKASLIGATFAEFQTIAIVDSTTLIPKTELNFLSPDQQAIVQRLLSDSVA